MAKSKEVVKIEDAEFSIANVPEFMKEQGGLGAEDLSSAALTPPRLKLAQATSPELEDYPELRPGDYFNNVSGEIYGKEVFVIPCYLSESYLLFAPKLAGSSGGLLARASDGVHWNPADSEFEVVVTKEGKRTKWRTAETVSKSRLDQWGTFDPDNKSSPPAAVHCINVIVMLADKPEEGPMAFTFLRSGLKIGKKFAGNLKMSRVPSFGRVMQLTSIKVEGDSGPYLEPRFKPNGFVSDVSVYNEAMAMYKMAKERGVDVDVAGEAQAGVNEAASGGADSDKY